MRACLIGDILVAADVVAQVPDAARRSLADALICQADAAHRYAKRLGRPHPVWGNGSLMARALAHGPRSPAAPSRTAFLLALAAVAAALAARDPRG